MGWDTPGPGKFEANLSLNLSEALYAIVNVSGADEFIGSVDERGWYGIIRWFEGKSRHFIVEEDNNGFFTYREFSDMDDANKIWNGIVEEYYVEE